MREAALLKMLEELRLATSLSTDLAGSLRGLVHNVLGDYGAVAAFAGILLKDSRFLVLDSYGYKPEVAMSGSLYSIWDPAAINDALRNDEILSFRSRKEYLEKYPQNAHLDLPGDGFVAIPIWKKGSPYGAIGISLNTDALSEYSSETDSVFKLVRLFSELQNDRPLWLEEMENNWDSVRDNLLGGSKRLGKLKLINDTPEKLTARQIQVLELLRDGLTNRQIGYRLKVSDSTIGKECVLIFRTIGAANRKEAVKIAESKGLLQPENEIPDFLRLVE